MNHLGQFIVPLLNEHGEPVTYNGKAGKYGVRDMCNTQILSVHDDLLEAAKACKASNPHLTDARFVMFQPGWRFGHYESCGDGWVDTEIGDCVTGEEMRKRMGWTRRIPTNEDQ